jgi:hypothetical protein
MIAMGVGAAGARGVAVLASILPLSGHDERRRDVLGIYDARQAARGGAGQHQRAALGVLLDA